MFTTLKGGGGVHVACCERIVFVPGLQSKTSGMNEATITSTTTAVIEEKFPEIRMALTKSEEEFEAQIRAMKHLPPPPPPEARLKPAASGGLAVPTTLRQETGLKLALPPVVILSDNHQRAGGGHRRRLHHQFEAEYDGEADTEFYKEFKFTFVCLPVPSEALPRE
jgi:hypothetical protein